MSVDHAEIRRLSAQGWSQRQIARHLGCAQSTVNAALRRPVDQEPITTTDEDEKPTLEEIARMPWPKREIEYRRHYGSHYSQSSVSDVPRMLDPHTGRRL